MSTQKEPLDWLENIQSRAKELRSEEEEVKKQIRNGFVDVAVIFMDVVGSTAFKQDYQPTPEVWILRVRQFSELLAEAVSKSNGRVVKYIGDEVMAVYENIFDAQNLVARIQEIEKKLAEATGFETRIKVSADYGKVYYLKFPGHDELDPQGPAVDRCARIGKFGMPGQVLASSDFAGQTPKLGWQKAGRAELKGLGVQTIYQLESVTVDLSPFVTIKEEEYNDLRENIQDLNFQVQSLKSKNESLVNELHELGQIPDQKYIAGSDDKEALNESIFSAIKKLEKVIKDAPVPSNQYARFLFLYESGIGERYNSYEGKQFDEVIEAGLVKEDGDGFYNIDDDHPRNQRAIELMRDVDKAIDAFLKKYDQPSDHLFKWSLSDPDFWEHFSSFYVTN